MGVLTVIDCPTYGCSRVLTIIDCPNIADAKAPIAPVLNRPLSAATSLKRVILPT